MNRARREFLVQSTLGLLGAAVAATPAPAQQAPTSPATPPPPPGQPPAFGTAPAVGPEVSAATFAEAEKLVRVEMTDAERAEAASNWRQSMAPLYERRTGPRKVPLEPDVAPYSLIRSVQPGLGIAGPAQNRFLRSTADSGPLPSSDEDIAYAPLWQLSRWIEQRRITSTRL
ncbi:MAG TPA: hypothetical protein VJV22_00410, partial [Acidobacteriaceae bacterium]|nr:hypothetical protein [Acidobacteriaceae bacterium]